MAKFLWRKSWAWKKQDDRDQMRSEDGLKKEEEEMDVCDSSSGEDEQLKE